MSPSSLYTGESYQYSLGLENECESVTKGENVNIGPWQTTPPPYWFCIRFPCNVWIAMLVSEADVLATGAAVCDVLANAFELLNNIIARRLK